MAFLQSRPPGRSRLSGFGVRRASALALAAGLGSAGLTAGSLMPLLAPPPALAQGTPGLMEFRWENTKDYRKLYYYQSDTVRSHRSEYYFILRPKDRKTAILKLSITIPENFDVKIDPKRVQLCRMSEGGMLKRTRCREKLPAVIEVSKNGRALEVFPETPVPVEGTIGVYMPIFNPSNMGMFQFNALAQAPGEIPVSGYLGSWLIQVEPN
ncbi:MAG: DUF2808 domain-containing protein [Synechococcaceae cyanobacterium]|nr:DUF2808 domain-containing protein [Synechococcaceae cyanobacterium]